MQLFAFFTIGVILFPLVCASLSDSFCHHLSNNGLLEIELHTDDNRTWPTRTSFKKILSEFVGVSLENRFVINLGAQDGDNYDPVFELLLHENQLKRYYSGIFIEASHAYERNLRSNVRRFNNSGGMHMYIEFALASTIVARLQSANCPLDPDVLKIDIDSVDLPVLQAIFQTSRIRPKVVMAEVNGDIPPPWMWHQNVIRKTRSETFYGNYGTGVYALYNLLDMSGYVPVGVELGSSRGNCIACEHNMWFVSKELYQKKAQDKRYDITFLDFSRSFWISLLKYSAYIRKAANKKHQAHLKLDQNAVSCVQLDVDRCPYTLMQRFGQKHEFFRDRDFARWQTWYDLQMFLMSAEGNSTSSQVLHILNRSFKQLDVKSGVMRNESAKMYLLPNAMAPVAYTPRFSAVPS